MSSPDQKLVLRKGGDSARSQHKSDNILAKTDPNLATTWKVMEEFCSLANLAMETERSLSPELVQDAMTSVMYNLLHMSFETGSLDEAVRLGLLTLSYITFLQWQETAYSDIYLPPTYRNCLINFNPKEEYLSHLLMWLLMMGAISKSTASDNTWLKDWLREHINVCQVKSWTDMREMLKSLLWVDLLLDGPAKDIFDQLIQKPQMGEDGPHYRSHRRTSQTCMSELTSPSCRLTKGSIKLADRV